MDSTPVSETEEDKVFAVAEAIRQSGGIKPETPPTAEELAEIEERRQRFRHYWHRQAEERRREEEAERLEAQRQAAELERQRIERVRAEARESARQHALKVRAAAEERQRNAQIAQQQNEWTQFKAGIEQAQAEKQRQAWHARQWQLIDELDKQINPPPTPEQEVSEPAPYHLGSRFFDPSKTRW